MTSPILISNISLCLPDEIIAPAFLFVNHGKIQSFGKLPVRDISTDDVLKITLTPDYFLTPGFIDTHIHGINHADVMDGKTSALQTIASSLPATGTTSFLATTMTAPTSKIESALASINQYQSDASHSSLLGVHLEGPFLSPDYPGAHPSCNILPPDLALFEKWQTLSGNQIKLVTVAPEIPKAIEFIQSLKQMGIITAIGHTGANYETTTTAIDAGARHATHLFNAMTAIHHRQPGAAIACLLNDTIKTELILDQHHLHPAMIETTFKMKGSDGIILMTDAMRASCCGDGHYALGDETVTVKGNAARLADGTLAGSVLTMQEAIKNMMQITDCDLLSIIKMAAENPAKQLNVFTDKGSIEEGKDADLLILDQNYDLILTLCQGHIAYQESTGVIKNYGYLNEVV